MQKSLLLHRFISSIASLILGGSQIAPIAALAPENSPQPTANNCNTNQQVTNFLVIAGGGSPRNNEIALEKNVLYFQRTLQTLGYNPAGAEVFFANGDNGQATVRYLDTQRREQFKVPNIPYLRGSATLNNFLNWVSHKAINTPQNPVFFYFTGHGTPDNLILWENSYLTVQQLAKQLARLPQDTPVVTMMAQCYAGSFAKFIYEGGDPRKPLALQTRCGFFATISTRPSVGCTPEVNEADYRDYSSSFFAGLSGRSRTGGIVASADYNEDGQVSFAEAHAFAKIDGKTTDIPVSTAEVWLQDRVSAEYVQKLWQIPIASIISSGRPEQQYVVTTLAKIFNFELADSYADNYHKLSSTHKEAEISQAYLQRLSRELVNIAMEKQIRTSQDTEAIAILNRLIQCEASSL